MVLSGLLDKYMPRRGNNDFISKLRTSLKRELSKIAEGLEDEDAVNHEEQQESLFQIDPCSLVGSDYVDLKKLQQRKTKAMAKVLYCIVGITLLSWFVGMTGCSWAWIILGLLLAGAMIRSNLHTIVDEEIRFQKQRLYKKRALETDETCEWLNLFLNRWWVFSSSSIFTILKKIIDPLLQESKPSFVEIIHLKEMTLGDRTPLLRSIRCWDAHSVGGQEQSAFKTGCSLHTPSGLALAPTHALAVLCEFTLDSDNFSAILGAKVGHKGMGVELDIGVEHLVLEGRLILTLHFDMEAPFPHIARISFSFVEQPRVSFRVKMLKSMQMMEVPLLKTWIYSLVTETLATAFVDPSQLEFSINPNDSFISDHRHRESLAKGVLTISLRLHRTTTSANLDEDKWIVIVVGGSTHISPCFKSLTWEDSCSFLLFQTIAASTISIKVKSKRLITTTITQYDFPLSHYNLDTCGTAETILQKKGGKGIGQAVPSLCVKMEYASLPPVSLEEAPPVNQEEIDEAGVLYVIIHGADNLTSRRNELSPYCLLFNKRKKIKATHFERATLSPRWESGTEFLVSKLSAVCLTFLVCSKNSKQHDGGDLLGIQTLNLSSVTLPLLRKKFPLNRNSSSRFPEETSASNSTISISLVFRSVPSVVASSPSKGRYSNRGMSGSIPKSVSVSSLASDISPVGSTISPTSNLSSANVRACDEDGQKLRKRNNPRWLSQAKILLSSHGDSVYSRNQDLEGIFAAGLGLIELTIIRARDLVSRDRNGFSDPFCVLKVNGEVKYRTQVKKKTLDPEWNESLMTHLPRPDQTLTLTLWDHDAFGMKDFLGSVSLTEERIRTLSASNSTDWFKLEETTSGCIEIKVKLISDNQEFYTKSSIMSQSLENNDTQSDDSSKTGSDNSSHEKHSTSAMDSGNILKPVVRNTSPYIRRKQMIFEDKSNLPMSASMNIFAAGWEDKNCTNNHISSRKPPNALSKGRKSGAEILSSALLDARKSSSTYNLNEKGRLDLLSQSAKNDESAQNFKKEINSTFSKSEIKLTMDGYNSRDEVMLTSDGSDNKNGSKFKESGKEWKKGHHGSLIKLKGVKDKLRFFRRK